MKIFASLLFLFVTCVFAHPAYDTWGVYTSIQVNKCQSANDVDDLCQRCAKLTTSDSVYPMCCTNTDDVRNWCAKALEYGQR